MEAYKKFIIAVGKLLGGDDEMAKRAEEIVAFEKKLAKVRTLTECSSVSNIYNLELLRLQKYKMKAWRRKRRSGICLFLQ